jgi:hypothetical protein
MRSMFLLDGTIGAWGLGAVCDVVTASLVLRESLFTLLGSEARYLLRGNRCTRSHLAARSSRFAWE